MKFTPKATVAVSVILAALVAGAVFFGNVGGSDGNGLAVKLFLVFLGAIIAVQVVPGAMLFGAMIKALSTLTRKETVKETRK